MAIIEAIGDLDRAVLDGAIALRTDALTLAMRALSTDWVRGPVIVGAGVVAWWRTRPRPAPLTPLLALAAYFAASGAARLLKVAVDRDRPPLDGAADALVALPGDASFPSGHAATAFAAAVVVGAAHPRLRAPLLALAGMVALSRIYLGVHYPLDVAAGGALGVATAWIVLRAARLAGAVRRRGGLDASPDGAAAR
ncbi:MAG: phosphatase PAP2 family protein [Thermoleophilia bacterium]